MAKCYYCEDTITSLNQTFEHIILNACGGRLKSKDLLCKSCNSKFGDCFDKELAKQTNDLANLLSIKRHRGEPQPIKGKLQSTGENYYLLKNGYPMPANPKIIKESIGNTTVFTVSARNKNELRQVLTGLKKKHPQLDIENFMKTVRINKEYLSEPIKIQSIIGGNEVFKSIAKTAINFFIYKGGERKYITHIFPYLEGIQDLEIVAMHYPNEMIYFPPAQEVSHIIRLIGNPLEKILYVYIELFNTQNYIVKLNENYEGKSIDETYVFDLLINEKIDKSIPLTYRREEFLKLFFNNNGLVTKNLQDRYQRVLQIANNRQTTQHFNFLLNKAIENSINQYPEGTIITEEIANELALEVMKEITPFIIHKLK